MPQLRLALAQVDPCVGDLDGNRDLVLAQCRAAAARGAHLVAFPEMVLTGYPIEDLALRASFVEASRRAVGALAERLADEGLGDLVVVLGYLDRADEAADRLGVPRGSPQNSAAVLTGGRVTARYDKHHLPNYGVFDEFRHFVPGDNTQVVRVHGVDVALAICEDIWQDGPSAAASAAGAGLLLVLNGSPYEANKDDVRLELCTKRAREGACALAYVNLVGSQDELVFDGDTIVVDADGELVARSGQFDPELVVVDLDLPAATTPASGPEASHGLRIERTVVSSTPAPAYEPERPVPARRLGDLEEIYSALVHGLRGYVTKNGFSSVLLGLSGGLDSALVAVLATDALGADRVFAVSNPSSHSSEHSRTDAADLARRTGIHLQTVPIAAMVDAFEDAVRVDGVAAENLQARVRAVVWMALSNQHGRLVLACGNKSELAVGYSTIYGDAVGGFAPIKDVPKTLAWDLARWRNDLAVRRGATPPIPDDVIDKPPSAELRPGQVDTDSLPSYDVLDTVLDAYVERDARATEVVAETVDPELVRRVVTMVDRAEYKRRQYPPGTKITERNFGRDRRVPMTNAWREPLP